jgi:hypothetical protein
MEAVGIKTSSKTMMRLLFILTMALMTMTMSAQEAVVSFKSAVPMPKEMKGKDWNVLSNYQDEFIIYSFKEGKLHLVRLDVNGNVKQYVQHKNTQFTLMNIFSNEQEIAVLSYDSNIGGLQYNTYDANTFAAKGQKALTEKRKDVFDSYYLSVSKNGQYIALLTNYVKKFITCHKLYIFDRDFNILTTCEALPHPDFKNLATSLEADMEVTDDGKVIITAFRTLFNNARRYDGDKSKLNFGKAGLATADYSVQMFVDIISKDGQQHLDIETPVNGLALRPNVMSYDDNHILLGLFVGNIHGMYAGAFALTNDYITLDCDLTSKKAIEKGRLSLPGAPWSCLLMYNNRPVKMNNVIAMADGSYIVPTDKNPRDPYNRFEVNFNREFIWADADGSNLTFGSWGSMAVKKQFFILGGVTTDGGLSVRFPFAGRYWLIDVPDTEVGTGTLRSCTRDGKMTETTPEGFQNIKINSHFFSKGGGNFAILNIGKQNKEDIIQVGSFELK